MERVIAAMCCAIFLTGQQLHIAMMTCLGVTILLLALTGCPYKTIEEAILHGGKLLIPALVPDKLASLEAKKNVLERAIYELNTHGLTGAHAIQGKHVDLMEYTNAYQELNLEGRLTARIYLGYDELPNCCIRTGFGDDMVKYGFYKLYADGNFGGYSAAMLEPFSDRPDTCGQANYTQEEMTARIRAAYERNIQVAVHVIGDRAADMLTTAIATVYLENPKPDPRFRMIHMSVLNEDIIQRIKKLPVMWIYSPCLSTRICRGLKPASARSARRTSIRLAGCSGREFFSPADRTRPERPTTRGRPFMPP